MVALHFGYKLFPAETIDDLKVEQYNILVDLWNKQAEDSMKDKKKNRYTTSIVSVEEGEPGANIGED